MAKDWMAVIGGKVSAWNIPAQALSDLSTLTQAAGSSLQVAQTESTRTPVATATCREDFDAMIAKMRDIKRRYFFEPPLTGADIISLGLKPHDSTPTQSGTPTAQVTLETFLIGRHELGVKIIYITGDPHDGANKGYRIWYSVRSWCDTPPDNPDELHTSFFTKRRKDVIEFAFDESGKTAYMAVQVENESKKGPWGPMTSALIP
jgi:hypothetical protein